MEKFTELTQIPGTQLIKVSRKQYTEFLHSLLLLHGETHVQDEVQEGTHNNTPHCAMLTRYKGQLVTAATYEQQLPGVPVEVSYYTTSQYIA